MNIPNTHVALVAITTDDGRTIDTRWTGKPGPVARENADVIGCDMNTWAPGIPVLTIGTLDNATGAGTITVTATCGGAPVGPLIIDVAVVAPGSGGAGQAQVAAGGLIGTLLMLVPKPKA